MRVLFTVNFQPLKLSSTNQPPTTNQKKTLLQKHHQKTRQKNTFLIFIFAKNSRILCLFYKILL